ncbi:MAG: 50S ribosomal protein L19e [Candidatus Thermoplasmatota archaeon]
MTNLKNQRRMAAQLLKCGKNRIWMDPDRIEEIGKAVTKDDIRVLINGNAIKAKQKKGISRGRKKYIKSQKKKGRRRGPGSIKGKKHARLPKKERWIKTIRPLRKFLRTLRDEEKISRSNYRKYYRKAKGGEFRSKHHLKIRLKSDGILSSEETEET